MYHPTDVHIGRRLRERRVAMGLSQGELAKKLGISFQQVQKYESGANRISGSRLWDFCVAMETPVEWFFEGLRGEIEADSSPLDRQTLELARALNSITNEDIRAQLFQLIQASSSQASSSKS